MMRNGLPANQAPGTSGLRTRIPAQQVPDPHARLGKWGKEGLLV